MRISRQIGWSTEANLIYELIRQTERLTITYGQNQPGFRVPISKPLSLSTESNLYYEWLRSLCKFTAQVADCCNTTTTTTTIAPSDCLCYNITNTEAISGTINYVLCGDLTPTVDILAGNTTICLCIVTGTLNVSTGINTSVNGACNPGDTCLCVG